MPSLVSLSPDEAAAGREFTDPARSREDLAALDRIRAALIRRVRSGLAGGTWTASGESHWLVAPGLRALAEPRPAFGVGFFGQTRDDVDHTPIIELEHQLLARARDLQGLLAYYDVRFVTGQWGNLVLFASEADAGRVRSHPTHVEALTLTARHYRSIRLHRLHFRAGALGSQPPALESTLLIDFGETPPWRALRLGPRE